MLLLTSTDDIANRKKKHLEHGLKEARAKTKVEAHLEHGLKEARAKTKVEARHSGLTVSFVIWALKLSFFLQVEV